MSFTSNEVGEDHGIPYVAMPLLQGESLESRLQRQERLAVAEVLRIGREIAEGLAAAHQRGLIHRDIKPANIWLEGERGWVKILDFGLARSAADEARVTHSGFVVGTPAYMAPEQAQGGLVNQRSDLFSLGCLLYHMLTGQPPFPGANALAVFHALAVKEPTPPRQLNPTVSPALEELVLFLLAKDPHKRSETAQAIVQALYAIECGYRHPEAEPPQRKIRLSLPSLRLPLFRHGRKLILTALVFVLAALVFLFGHSLVNFCTNRGELVVETGRDVLILLNQNGQRVRSLHAETTQSFDLPAGDYEAEIVEVPGSAPLSRCWVHLVRGGRTVISVLSPVEEVEPVSPRDLVLPLTLQGVGAPVWGVAFHPDGRRLAAVGSWKVKVWNLRSGTQSIQLEDDKAAFMSVAFSPDGKHLACGGIYSLARVWDLSSGMLELERHLQGEVRGLRYTADGTRLISASIHWLAGGPTNACGAVAAWSSAQGAGEILFTSEREQLPSCLVCSPDGSQVACSMFRWDPQKQQARAGDVRVWKTDSGKLLHTLPRSGSETRSVAYSPDSKKLFASAEESNVWCWDAGSGESLAPLRGGHRKEVSSLAVSPDGRWLASDSYDHTICLWDLETGRSSHVLRGHKGTVRDLAFSPNGQLLASAGDDGVVKVWDPHQSSP